MLKDMEYIYAVYLEKSFSKAAKKLFISQPALSAKVKSVESKIQTTIFDRSSNPIQLTPAGKYYIKSIEKIMLIQEDMSSYFTALIKEKNESINIGSSAFFCAHILPSIVSEFKNLYPSYNVNILETNVEELTNCLDTGVIDLSVGVEKLDGNKFIVEKWHQEHIILAVPSFYDLNSKLKKYGLTFEDIRSKEYLKPEYPAVKMQSFKDEAFILLRKGNDLYKRGMKICQNADFKPKVDIYLDQLLTSYYVAYGGKGVAFVRDSLVEYVEPTEKLTFYRIDDKNATRDIMIHYNKSSEESMIRKEFLAFMHKCT